MISKMEITNFLPAPVDEWLAGWREPVIEPDLPIVDPHHHLWHRKGWRYEDSELLNDILDGHSIRSTVFIQCREQYRTQGPEVLKPVGETEYVLKIAMEAQRKVEKLLDAVKLSSNKSNKEKIFNNTHEIELFPPHPDLKICEAIVGFADLTHGGDIVPALESHISIAQNRFRGIRHVGARYEAPGFSNSMPLPPEGLFQQPNFRNGFSYLKKYDLSFEAWVFQSQLNEVYSLAKDFPDTPIVINHVGGPLGVGIFADHKDRTFNSWKNAISKLSLCPNVSLKLGGLGMVTCGFGLNQLSQPPSSEILMNIWSPWINHCIEEFSPARCMFESNFPVDKTSCSYRVLWNTFKRLSRGYSTSERMNLFSGTACKFYKLSSIKD